MREVGSSMPSPDARDRIRAGALILASGLQIAESLVPRFPLFPWLRAGLSWAVIVPFLQCFGPLPALGLFLARNVLSVVFGGQPPTTFLISSASGVASLLVAGPVVRWCVARRWMGWVGAGIALATLFNVAQLLLVTWILVGHGGYLFQLGPILAWSVVSGGFTGWLAHRWFPDPSAWERFGFSPVGMGDHPPPARAWPLAVAGWAAVALAPAFLERPAPILCVAVGCLAHSLIRRRRDLGLLVSAWPFFVFLGWFHLLDTPGHLSAIPGITFEGISAFEVHAGRLVVFLLAGRNLFNWIPWTSVLARSPWSQAIGQVLVVLPHLFQVSVAAARTAWANRRDPEFPSFPRLLLDGMERHRGN